MNPNISITNANAEEKELDVEITVTADKNVEQQVEVSQEDLRRQLKSRHASMLALGGAIGTGLIIGSGTGLAHAGPVGLLISFIYVGTLCYAMLTAMAEMAAYLPHQVGFIGHATRFVGPSFGAVTGICYWLKYLLSIPSQFVAIAALINYWIPTSKVNNGVWIAILIVGTASLQAMPVRFFGEFEFWCSTIKVITLTGLMILCIIIDAGGTPPHKYIGFRTWHDLPFVEYLAAGSLGRFVGFWSALLTAMFSYTGSEMVGVAVGEMKHPRRDVPRAIKGCFYRIVFLYCGSIFCIGLVIPADSPLLLAANKHAHNASASPFVVAVNVAGIKVLPHIINAAAIIFVASAANSDFYVNSRTAFSLATEGNLPKIFMRTNRQGVPYYAVAFTTLFSTVAFTTVSETAYNTFNYLVQAITLVSTVVWIQIMFSHLRFVRACKLQGIERSSLPYHTRLQPFLSYWGIIGTAVISITKGFPAFVHGFHKDIFFSNYALPFAVVCYLFYSYRYKSWILPVTDVDLRSGVRLPSDDLENENDGGNVHRTVWQRIKYAWNS